MPRSKEELRNYLNGVVGQSISAEDGDLRGQCVSLIKGVMAYVGVPNPRAARGHAAQAGDQYIREGIGTPGGGWMTVCVNRQMAAPYGHIWIDIAGEFNIEQNGARALFVTKNTRPRSQAQQLVNFDRWVTDEALPPGVFEVTSLGANIRTAPNTQGTVVRVAPEGERVRCDTAIRNGERHFDNNYSNPSAHPTTNWYGVVGGGWVACGAVRGFPPDGFNWTAWNAPAPAPGTFEVTSLGANIRTAPNTQGAVIRVSPAGERIACDTATRNGERHFDNNYSNPQDHPTTNWYGVVGGGWVACGAVTGFPPDGWNNWIDAPGTTDPPPQPPPQPDLGPAKMTSYRDPAARWQPSPAFVADRRDRLQNRDTTGESFDLADGPSFVVMHHMDGTTDQANAHFTRAGANTSAHYGVSRDGSKIQWVDEKDMAFHAGNYACNRQSIGVEHEDRKDDNWTDQQIDASAQILADLSRRYGIPVERGDWGSKKPGVILHREVTATQCPGSLPVDRIIDRARQIATGPGPEPPPKLPDSPEELAAWLEKVAGWLRR